MIQRTQRRQRSRKRKGRAKKNTLLGKTVDLSLDAVTEQAHIEVDEQSELQLELLQVGNQLRTMDACEAVDCLHFDNNRIVDDQIDAVAAIQAVALVNERHRLLSLHRHAATRQLECQRRLVR